MKCPFCNCEYSDPVYPIHIQRCKPTQQAENPAVPEVTEPSVPPVVNEAESPTVPEVTEPSALPVIDEAENPAVPEVEFPRKRKK